MLWVVGMPTNLPRTRKFMSLRAVVHGAHDIVPAELGAEHGATYDAIYANAARAPAALASGDCCRMG